MSWWRRSARAPSGIVIAPMNPSHLDQVLGIERAVFPAPWSRALYRDELALGESRIYLVALRGRSVVGYIGVMLVVDEAHVATVAVHPRYQGQGIGKALLFHALWRAIARGSTSATLEVRVTNHHAQSLYHQFGFVPAGIRRNYYAEINEDGLVMWSHGLDDAAFSERMATIAADLLVRGLPVPAGVQASGPTGSAGSGPTGSGPAGSGPAGSGPEGLGTQGSVPATPPRARRRPRSSP